MIRKEIANNKEERGGGGKAKEDKIEKKKERELEALGLTTTIYRPGETRCFEPALKYVYSF